MSASYNMEFVLFEGLELSPLAMEIEQRLTICPIGSDHFRQNEIAGPDIDPLLDAAAQPAHCIGKDGAAEITDRAINACKAICVLFRDHAREDFAPFHQ